MGVITKVSKQAPLQPDRWSYLQGLKSQKKSAVGDIQKYFKLNFPPTLRDKIFELKKTWLTEINIYSIFYISEFINESSHILKLFHNCEKKF